MAKRKKATPATPTPPKPTPAKVSPPKPGRPPGSPNKEYAAAEEIPASCLRCNSTKLTRVPGSKEIERAIAGTLRSGFVYNRVRHTRKKCECGQTLIVKSYFVSDEPKPELQPTRNPKVISLDDVVEGVPYECWCEARQAYVAAELFTTAKGVKKWRIEGDIIARLSALEPRRRSEHKM
jgi:hypothetical protein